MATYFFVLGPIFNERDDNDCDETSAKGPCARAFCIAGTAAGDGSSAMMAEQFKGYVMKKLMTAAVALMVFGAGPA
ncbi:MAG: hypothetical protein J0H37_04870, partial [Hyphomicrobium denitrificans]|nr:hypothetical protein [Hyphomicrobium denitrificans]